MACDTEWRAVNRNLAGDMISDFARFIVASSVLRRVLHYLFSTLCGVLKSTLLRGTTEYVLMGFKVYYQSFPRTLVHLLIQRSRYLHTRCRWALAWLGLI